MKPNSQTSKIAQRVCSLSIALALCACASPSSTPPAPSAAATQAALNQIPARLLQKHEPNYLSNLSDFLIEKPSVPTAKP